MAAGPADAAPSACDGRPCSGSPCIFPDLPLELFSGGESQDLPLAVSARRDGRELISRCNRAAAALGIRPGLPLQAALALHGGLRVHARDPQAEQAALEDLALWAYQLSPRIAFDPLMLLLEIGASLRLFGGLEGLLDHLDREGRQLVHRFRRAVAPTPAAAALLARTRPGSIIETSEALAAELARIPLDRLTRERKARGLIARIGLSSIGDCLALPRAELARRAGPQLTLVFDRLLGRLPDPRPVWQPPERFRRRLELPAEIGHHTALVFPAHRLIAALCGYLRGHGAGAQHLLWHLQHRESAATCFEQGMLEPSRDPEHMLAIFRERIERLRLPEPVIAMMLQVDDWLVFGERSGPLLDETRRKADAAFLERLCNRLGEGRVRGLAVQADHRPERAWRLCEPGQVDAAAPAGPRQPPWLLTRPQPLDERQGRPLHSGGPLELEPGPERIETGWWDGFDVARDYFIARNRDGERLWVFRDRRSGRWYLHGMFG